MELATHLGLLVGAVVALYGELRALRSLDAPKRLLGYSTVAQVGYILAGVSLGTYTSLTAAFTLIGWQALLRALWYVCMQALAARSGGWSLDALRGQGRADTATTALMGLAMFCALGISPFMAPPGKALLLAALADGGHVLAAIALACAGLMAAIYTVRLFQAVCLESVPHAPEGQALPAAFGPGMTGWILGGLTVLGCVFPQPLMHLTEALAAGLANASAGLPELEGPWPLAALVPYAGGFIVWLACRWLPSARTALVLTFAAATVAAAWATPDLAPTQSMFVLLYALMGALIVVYSVGYVGAKKGADHYYLYLFAMIGSLLGLSATSGHGQFYAFWELMTLSSYMLVVHKRSQEALKAGARYFIMCAGGACFMQVGLMCLAAAAPHAPLGQMALAVQAMGPGSAALVILLLLAGFGAKAGLFPLHSWLPVAHPVAPSSISAPLSGLLTKAGVLGLVLALPALFTGQLADTGAWGVKGLLTLAAAVTFVLGEVMALSQNDIKRMLAYSTLAQIGEITLVLSLGTWAATVGGLGHTINHAVMKDLLFLAAGGLILRAGTQRISGLEGIGRAMPFTGACMAVGLVAIMGLPPFSGFMSKFLMLNAALEAGSAWIAVLVLAGSLVGCVYYGRLIKVLFFTPWKGGQVAETPLAMRAVVGVLAALTVLGGLLPASWLSLAVPAATSLLPQGVTALPDLSVPWALPALLPMLGAVAAVAMRKNQRQSGLAVVGSLVLAVLALIATSGGWGSLQFCFALVVLLLGACNLYYSTGYMTHSHTPWRFFAVFGVMISGLVGMGSTTTLVAFFCFWEIMSSWPLFFAIIHEESPVAQREGTKYFLFNVAGASFLFLGILMVGHAAGGYGFEAVTRAYAALPASAWGLGTAFMMLGMLMKAAMLPIRIDWQMHPATAPTPVSGYISAMLLKSAPFGLVLLRFGLAGGATGDSAQVLDTLMYVGAWIGGITILYAALQALVQTGIKEMLIYSTVSQLGYIVLGVCLGTPLGMMGGLLHFFNHMLFKDLAFLCAGALMFATHAHNLNELGGIGRRMPFTLLAFATALFAAAGMPPFNGFISKLTLYYALIERGEMILAIVAILSSVITLAYFLKFLHSAFFGQASPAADHAKEVGMAMRAPILVLAGLCLLTGVFPGLAMIPIASLQTSLGMQAPEVGLTGILSGPGAFDMTLLTYLVILSGGLVYSGVRYVTRGVRRTAIHTCGQAVDTPDTRVAAADLYAAPLQLLSRLSKGHFVAKSAGGTHD